MTVMLYLGELFEHGEHAVAVQYCVSTTETGHGFF